MGLSKASAYAVIDIDADERGGSKLQGYTYYRNAGAQKVVTRIIDAINEPAKCE